MEKGFRCSLTLAGVLTALVLVVIVGGSIVTARGPADVITVCPPPGTGCDYTTIQAAIANANVGDEIRVAEGTYVETLDIAQDLILKGGYESAGWTRDIAAHPTIVDADGADDAAVGIYPNANVIVEGLIVQGANHVSDVGGGFLIDRATVVISGTVIQNNLALGGGGIYIEKWEGYPGSLALVNSSLLTNTASTEIGGGLRSAGWPTVTLEIVEVRDNTALAGGGGLGVDRVTIAGSQIVNNTSGEDGGGIAADLALIYESEIGGNEANGVGDINGGGLAVSAELHLEKSIVHNNRVEGTVNSGASAISASEADVTIVDSRLSDNKNGNLAVALWATTFDMTNSLVVDNDGHGIGGDERALTGSMMNVTIANNGHHGIRFTADDVRITNSILWGSDGQDNACTGNCTLTYSDVGSGATTGSGNISEDPLFVDTANGDYHLRGISPCIDRGTPAGAPPADIEGTPRDGAPDMGAYEWTGYRLSLPLVSHNYRRTVHILVSGEAQAEQFEEAMRSFEQETGIDLLFEGVNNFEEEIVNRAQAGTLPDVAMFSQPGLLGDLVAGGYTLDLYDWFDLAYLQQQYEQSWLDMATKQGQMAGVWYRANLKSVVYYPVPEFQQAGYKVPQTWAELVALSDEMVADGRAPWCLGIESGPATGWVGTDWVEDIMLRTTTPENYDQWVKGDLAFASPEVKNAFETMGALWFAPNYVLGGRAAILSTFFGDAPTPMFDNPPSCWLHRQGTFITGFFPGGVAYGTDYDYFYLPPIEAQYGDPALIAGDLFGVFGDQPQVKKFVEYLTLGESVKWWIERGWALSPHKDADLDWYPVENRGYAQIVMDADAVRFDGSDLMPGEVGAGSFWQGIVDYVNGVDLDTILAGIDASWP